MLEKLSLFKFNPSKIGLGLILYFIIWTILPFILSASYPLDVPEGIYWGREWQWGYYKHPPLSSWILFCFYTVFGHIGPYLLSQCTIALSLWLAYRLGLEIMSRQRAFLGALLLLTIFYFTWPSLEFNHNVAQIPIWLGLIYTFFLAIRYSQWHYWLIFGLLAGVGMMIKYSVAILLITIVLYSLITPYRRLWLTLKPWTAILLAFIVFSPNIIWLFQHNWLPFTYAESRSLQAESKHGRLAALGFLATQLINHVPLFLILLCTKTRLCFQGKLQLKQQNDWFFLLFLGLAPALLLVSVGLILNIGLRDMWGMPMWGLSGLIVAAMIPQNNLLCKNNLIIKGIAIWLVIVTVLMIVYIEFGARIRNKPSRMDWPQVALAQNVDQQWQQLSNCRLDSLTGSDWVVLLAASYSKYSPSVMVSGNKDYSPWMSDERLSQYGTLAIWPAEENPDLPWLQKLAQNKHLVLKQGVWTIQWNKLPKHKPLMIKWQAYIPVSCLKQ